MYRVNPPLVRVAAAIPVLYSVEYDWSGYKSSIGNRPEFTISLSRLRTAKLVAHGDFCFPRLVCIVFPVIGSVVLTRWISDVIGEASANVACVLWWFCPNMLAYGFTINPDMGAISLGVVACRACCMFHSKAN